MSLRNTIFIILCLLFLLTSCAGPVSSPIRLWYDEPADTYLLDNNDPWKDDEAWLRALPLGNGSLGAMVYGGVNKERIQLNESSLWSGSPSDNDNEKAFEAQTLIRELLFKNQFGEANAIVDATQVCKGAGTGYGQGKDVPYGCYQSLGNLWLDFENTGEYSNYSRSLNLEDAVVQIEYQQDDVLFQREVFVSKPDQALVVRFTSSKKGSLSFFATLERSENAEIFTENNQLVMKGQLPDGKGGKGMQFLTLMSATTKGGTVEYLDKSIHIQNADEVVMYITGSTDYTMEYPDFLNNDYKSTCERNLENVKSISYHELKNRHVEDYHQYFNRMSFDLDTDVDSISTDERVLDFSSKKGDLHLVELMFHFGRYLLISSSRPGSLPANLQGIWATGTQTPWNADYHTNINVQMNYWPAEVANLSEMHLPLFDLVKVLSKTGQSTAKIHYNADGWVVHPVTNVWGYSSPGEQSGWGMHLAGGAWITSHIMEHYYFTLDTLFLREHYDIIKASCAFYLDWLIEHPVSKELISGPSSSPENAFYAPDGTVSKICMGPAHDHQVIWNLFRNFIDASEALDIENDFVKSVESAMQSIAKPKIGSDGRIMEWYEEYKEVEPGHRHFSHLFALHPGTQIDVKKTPELAVAAKKSLDYRLEHGGGHTGWSAAWLVNQYARLLDGENAYRNLNKVLQNSTAENLFGLHPPFQIDGNFGVLAGILEMLLQSQSESLRILPALPKAWASGSIKGIRARGGFIVDIEWENGELSDLKVFSLKGGVCYIEYKDMAVSFASEKDSTYQLNKDFSFRRESF